MTDRPKVPAEFFESFSYECDDRHVHNFTFTIPMDDVFLKEHFDDAGVAITELVDVLGEALDEYFFPPKPTTTLPHQPFPFDLRKFDDYVTRTGRAA